MRDPQPEIAAFRTNVAHIKELLELDQLILRIPIRLLESVQQAQEKVKPRLDNPNIRVEKALHVLRTIRDNDSVAPRLQVVRNQCVVLLVSHFTSGVRSILLGRLARSLQSGEIPEVAYEPLALSASDILALGSDPSHGLAEAIVRRKDVSFQDMKSIARALDELLGIQVERTAEVNDLVVAMSCRHAIVHNGARVDDKLLRQIKGADPRSLRPKLHLGSEIAFTDAEVMHAAESMERYLLRIAS
jgi:hypothetical protein